MATAVASAACGLKFTREADMLRPLAEGRAALLRDLPPRARRGRRPLSAAPWATFFEVTTPWGVADVVHARLDAAVVDDRQLSGADPLLDPLVLRARLLLDETPGVAVGVAALSNALRVGASTVRRRIWPQLSVRPDIVVDPAGALRALAAHRTPLVAAVAIEAKIKDWRRALGQASTYARWADASYVALDARSVAGAAAQRQAFEFAGVGLLGLPADGRAVTVFTAAQRGERVFERLLVGEQLLALHQSGRCSGDVFPVFGRMLTTQDDPRL